MNVAKSDNGFKDGLVFGFDVGTGSIGYAVRRGSVFLHVGVLICDSEGSDLSKRRELRRQRRTLRSRKYRRQWFANELVKLGLPKPEQPPHDPISLRFRAINGESLKPEELHAALTHLFKRRGYSKVPWANSEKMAKETVTPRKMDDDEGVKEKVDEIRKKLGIKHPCQFLAEEKAKAGKSPTNKWARKIYWPREVLRDEFLAIAKAQTEKYPKLVAKADWLLYGDSQPKEKNGETFHVFFKTTEARNPGVLAMRWPRFDNRGPSLDSLQPVDGQGRPLHVVRKNKEAFNKAQWELALMNFRVLDPNTRQKIDPRAHFPVFIENLRNEWNKKGKVTEARLKKLAQPFEAKFLLIEDQKPLTPETGAGRARYSSPTLELIRKEIGEGRRVDPPQPILRRNGETVEQALNRYLADIKHPLVRHRLVLFRRLLKQFVSHYGQPDMIVAEAVRSLALGQKAKNELNKRNETFRKERENARDQLSSNNDFISRKAIQRYRLWQEAKGRCPFCLQTIERTDLGHGADIEHLVPRAIVDCNEFYNLTVAHVKCNRELKGERTPLAAFGETPQWLDIKAHAEKTFSGRKLEIFLSPNAEQLIEQKVDLQHTAYIARVIRHVSLIQLGWLNGEGRDPTIDEGNKPSAAFQVTNGQLTSRLRKAWGLNQILHSLPAGKRWDELTKAEQNQFTEKNRGDLRHHALDAMVICCTLPWLAHRTHGATDEFGRHGWWTQDKKLRSKAANPIFPNEGQMHDVAKQIIDKVAVLHHVSRSNHKRGYDTTIYGRKSANIYVAREKLTDLKEKDLLNIYPDTLGAYVSAAWECFKSDAKGLEEVLKSTKGRLPVSFVEKLCFSHFQKWRERKGNDFYWAEQVKIPIRSVKYVGVHDDKAVSKASPGTHGYVARGGFKEVRIHRATDGKNWVPVFVPYWKGDRLIHDQPYQPGKPNKIIRIGDFIDLRNGYGPNNPPGIYRVVSTMQKQIQLMPPHIADTKEALKASGYLENGINLRWPAFFKATGYELPHPSSVKPQPESPDQA